MLRDPFYRKIVERLSQLGDGNLFEACACALLQREWPTLVRVPGGNDEGIDGAWADDGGSGIVVATIGKNVIANVTKNLREHLRKGNQKKRVLVATSQALTPARRRNIEARVTELGFRLAHQPYDRSAVADRLYRDSKWCRELLGITGAPPALAAVSQRSRPTSDLPLVGRVDDLEWLRTVTGDRVIVGQPGVGKTHLLRQMVFDSNCLFVVEDDLTKVIEGIRDLSPQTLLIEDAHFRLQLLRGLRRSREQTGLEFAIVADCWSGGLDDVLQELNVPLSSVRRLTPLAPQQIVELAKAARVFGPPQLLHQIVRQSVGNPGLAAILIHIIRSGDAKQVMLGDALASWVRATMSTLAGDECINILAAFSIGGSAGMNISKVAALLGYPLAEVHRVLSQLAIGGLIGDVGEDCLAVYPEPLRCVLVRDRFFNDAVKFSYDDFRREAPSKSSAAKTAIGAYARGASIGSNKLLEVVDEADDIDVWSYLLWCDGKFGPWIVASRPELVSSLARPLLVSAPELMIPRLMESAIGDGRRLESATDHGLRLLSDWVTEAEPSSDEAIDRRAILARIACQWIVEERPQAIGLRAIKIAFSLRFEAHERSPGAHNVINFRHGTIAAEDVSKLSPLWQKVAECLSGRSISDWQPLLELLDQLVFPYAGSATHELLHERSWNLAEQVIRDLVAYAGPHVGVLARLSDRASIMGCECGKSENEAMKVFETLYPREDRIIAWRERDRQQLAAADELARQWSTMSPEIVCGELKRHFTEASMAGREHPRWAPYICGKISEVRSDCLAWIDEMLQRELPSEFLDSFLQSAVSKQPDGWRDRVDRCLSNASFVCVSARAVLQEASMPSDIVERAVSVSAGHESTFAHLSISGRLSDLAVLAVYTKGDRGQRAAVTKGLWHCDPDKTPPSQYVDRWRKSVVNDVDDQHFLCEVFEEDNLISFEWLQHRAATTPAEYTLMDDAIEVACRKLDANQRRAILRDIRNKFESRPIVQHLVGTDTEIYRDFLGDHSQRQRHFYPLELKPTRAWAELAIAALDAGYLAEDIVAHAFRVSRAWVGQISDQYAAEAAEWERLSEHPDERVRAISDLGRKRCEAQMLREQDRERREQFQEIYD